MVGVLTQAIEQWNWEYVKNILLFYMAWVLFFHISIWFTKNRWRAELQHWYIKIIHEKYVKDFVYLDNDAVEKVWTWKMVSIIEKWINQRWMFISQTLHHWCALVLSFFYVSYLFFKLWNWYILWFYLFLIFVTTTAYFFNKKMLKARRTRVYANNRYAKQLIRIIMSKVEVMQSWNQVQEMEKLNEPQNAAIKANQSMNPRIHYFFYVPQFLLDAWRIVLFFFMAKAIISGAWSLSVLVSLWVWIVYLDSIVERILFFYKDITKQFDTVQRMREFFDESKPKRNYDAWEPFVYAWKNIVFNDVDFWYTQQKVFENFSLEIMWSKKTALVWVSWSWKSTLVKLIAWYLEKDWWSILVDWQNLADLKLTSYWKKIWFLTQEPNVFDGTIYENLTYALQGKVDEKRLEKALCDAKCDFVFDFEKGIHTEIWERWIRLSGWQRQRLALAKVFLKDPSIIILDEPTSALDSFSEEAITQAMHTLFAWRTVLIIAHRLQTVKNADDILVFEEWTVIERGTHQQLVDKWWSYARMLELQSWF